MCCTVALLQRSSLVTRAYAAQLLVFPLFAAFANFCDNMEMLRGLDEMLGAHRRALRPFAWLLDTLDRVIQVRLIFVATSIRGQPHFNA